MIRIKSFLLLISSICILSCSSSDNEEDSSNCFTKDAEESFEMEPSQCVVITENPDMTLVLIGFENHIKSDNNVYETIVTVRLEEPNFTWETPHVIMDDPETEIIKFTGLIQTGINDDSYTIYVDNIEFTETETEFIFYNATIRVGYSNN